MQTYQHRQNLKHARRIVVKIGSRVLVQRSGKPDLARMKTLVHDIASLQKNGHEVVVVSSGAIGAGMQALGMTRRPTNLPDMQMAAAVGQTRLMTTYDKLFSSERCRIGQVLLTHDALKHRLRHLNARNTLMNLMRHKIIPIVNENDAVSVDEIKFGDNDLLASLVALLIQADLLILLTTVDGLRAPTAHNRTTRVKLLERVTDETLQMATGKGSELSTGGMASKLQSAEMAATGGIPVVIANGRRADQLGKIAQGSDVGTLILNRTMDNGAQLSGRKRWIAFFHRAMGSVTVDEGAYRAIAEKGTSLLPIGIKKVDGVFDKGALINIQTSRGKTFARGLAEYTSNDIRKIKGHKTTDIASLLGCKDYDEVIHRDNMVLLDAGKEGADI